jgi:hypothetical protein
MCDNGGTAGIDKCDAEMVAMETSVMEMSAMEMSVAEMLLTAMAMSAMEISVIEMSLKYRLSPPHNVNGKLYCIRRELGPELRIPQPTLVRFIPPLHWEAVTVTFF